MLITKGNTPKRFIDRSDRASIIKDAYGFYKREHDNVSNLLYYFFALLVVSFLVILIYLSTMVLQMPGPGTNSLYIVNGLFLSFFVLLAYCVYLVKTLKKALNATEFINLCVSRTVENFSGAYCLLNKNGRIFYYNEPFLKEYMSSNAVESKAFPELLNPEIFGESNIVKLSDAMLTNATGIIAMAAAGKGAKIQVLSRPKGIYALCVVEA